MADRTLTEREAKALTTLTTALEALHDVHDEMTIRTAITFLRLALDQGTTQSDLARYYGWPKTSVNRNIKLLQDKGVRGNPGLGLLDLRADDVDERAKPVGVSPKGARLIRTLDHILSGVTEGGNS
ncbi:MULTISPECIES: helix-turn-helix domain-containing protein [Xanthobacter]|uniref:MarR family transcriptional regulator n=1 Tax=Xanthobacter TaxID=279 RepID=UPI001F2FC1E7|nr:MULTISPECIES: helix-turn-helix domain-containing protein [Xanthobacter]MCL8384178.1 MarR family winged helix-turn-helix transcriptional regulator [Xanthobacter aminoxidans]